MNIMEKNLMHRLTLLPAVLFVTLSAIVPAAADPGHSGFAAGEPGNPKKAARVVQVSMQEGDGKMSFSLKRLVVRRGEQVRFVLVNKGELDHEFVLASPKENLKHAELMMKYPRMEHADPNAKRLAPKKNGELLWRFTKRGEFEFACLIPGHRESGMIGKVVVK
jgi:uncharacterized cupredoxin-like copper-binding protein